MIPTCCYLDDYKIGCRFPAQWRLVFGRSPDDYTEACTEHVGHLLTDVLETVVSPIKD